MHNRQLLKHSHPFTSCTHATVHMCLCLCMCVCVLNLNKQKPKSPFIITTTTRKTKNSRNILNTRECRYITCFTLINNTSSYEHLTYFALHESIDALSNSYFTVHVSIVNILYMDLYIYTLPIRSTNSEWHKYILATNKVHSYDDDHDDDDVDGSTLFDWAVGRFVDILQLFLLLCQTKEIKYIIHTNTLMQKGGTVNTLVYMYTRWPHLYEEKLRYRCSQLKFKFIWLEKTISQNIWPDINM